MDQKIRKCCNRPVAGFTAGYFEIVVAEESGQAVAEMFDIFIFDDDGIIIKDKPVGQRIKINRHTDDSQYRDGQQISGDKPGRKSLCLPGDAVWGCLLL